MYPASFFRQILTASGFATRVSVVGNGPICAELNDSIDRHDLVVRFNSCHNYGVAGQRTDILVLVNTGPAAKSLAHQQKSINAEALASAKQVWLAKEPDLIATRRKQHPEAGDLWDDWSQDLIENRLQTKSWEFLSSKIYYTTMADLKKFGAQPHHDPSTGILAIRNILETIPKIMSPCVVTLFGFTHQGWAGHPWEAERAFIDTKRKWIRRA